MNSLDVSLQLLSTAHGPVVSMEGRLHQRSHNTPHRCFIPAAVALTVMLHAQPAPTGTDKRQANDDKYAGCQDQSPKSLDQISTFWTTGSL